MTQVSFRYPKKYFCHPQDYVKELAKLLLAHGDEPGSDGFRQLEDYVLQAVSCSDDIHTLS